MQIKKILETYVSDNETLKQFVDTQEINLGYQNGWSLITSGMFQELLPFVAEVKIFHLGRSIEEYEATLSDAEEKFVMKWGCDSSD